MVNYSRYISHMEWLHGLQGDVRLVGKECVVVQENVFCGSFNVRMSSNLARNVSTMTP